MTEADVVAVHAADADDWTAINHWLAVRGARFRYRLMTDHDRPCFEMAPGLRDELLAHLYPQQRRVAASEHMSAQGDASAAPARTKTGRTGRSTKT